MRKHYLVDIYLANNLGDDLFLDHLAKSFPETDFTPFYPGRDYADFFSHYSNVHQFPYALKDKLLRKIGLKDALKAYEKFSKNYDGLIFLGGGIFREESYWIDVYKYRSEIVKAFKNQGKKVLWLSCNFGPHNSKKFEDFYREIFNVSDYVFFRDRFSHNLFKDLKNVHYAPDILWSYNLPQVNKTTKTLGVSVIDPSHKPNLLKYRDTYINTHKQIICEYLKKGWEVRIFSFCSNEGDLKIANEIGADFMGKLKILNYGGDLSTFLTEIGSCNLFIASRFHAVVLSVLFKIKVLPVIYNIKTLNLLDDIQFNNSSVLVEDLENFKNQDLQHYVYPEFECLKFDSTEMFRNLSLELQKD